MKTYAYWTTKEGRQPLQLMCVGCGAVRPTLHFPEFKVDPVTNTFGLWVAMAMAQHKMKSDKPGG